MSALLVLAALVLLMCAGIAAVAVAGTVLTVRKVRRSRALTRGSMLWRTVSAPSAPAREVSRLRVGLYDSMTATSRLLTGVHAPDSLGALALDLQRAAAVTDQRLALLAAEPDQVVLSAVLPPLGVGVRGLQAAAAEVRAAAWQFAAGLDDLSYSALTLDVEDRIAGLRAGLAEVEALRSTVLGRPAGYDLSPRFRRHRNVSG